MNINLFKYCRLRVVFTFSVHGYYAPSLLLSEARIHGCGSVCVSGVIIFCITADGDLFGYKTAGEAAAVFSALSLGPFFVEHSFG